MHVIAAARLARQFQQREHQMKTKVQVKKSDLTIKKLGRIHDKSKDTYLEIIEFPINDTERRQDELPPSVVSDPRSFEKHLRDKGAKLPKDDVKGFLQAVAAKDCPKEFIYEARTGWSDDCSIFVLTNGAIGPNTGNILGINQSIADEDQTGRLTQAGTWQSWKSAVANNAAFSSLLIFGTCVAFAAPLLAVVGEGSFTLCIVGLTRTGICPFLGRKAKNTDPLPTNGS